MSLEFVLVTDTLRKKVRDLLDYFKEQQPEDETSVIILTQREHDKKNSVNQVHCNIYIFFI